jgi:hypothetical protein
VEKGTTSRRTMDKGCSLIKEGLFVFGPDSFAASAAGLDSASGPGKESLQVGEEGPMSLL